jgi:hypothetical protein
MTYSIVETLLGLRFPNASLPMVHQKGNGRIIEGEDLDLRSLRSVLVNRNLGQAKLSTYSTLTP